MEKRWIWPFELEEQIGSGAMGVVFRARYVKNDRRVALKLLPKDVAANPTLAARFQREMEILKDLRHPHIVHAFGGTCEGDQWFYAMELIDGGTLATLLQEQGRLPWRQAVDFGLQVCAALEYAHARGVIHRDLKPGNLLLTRAGKAKLGDFGLALVSAETRLTAAGKTMGSLHYMAPEQIQGKPPLSNKTDLYALGCVMFELLCGRTPFTGEAMAEVLQQHIRQAPPKVSSFALDCPVQLEALIAELLQKEPERRPATAQLVANRLREIDQDVTVKAPRFDKNRPVVGTGGKTASVVIPVSPRTWNRHLVIGLIVSLIAIGWLLFARWEQQQANARLQGQIVAALRNPQSAQPVRFFAAKSLGEIGPEATDALRPLLDALGDADSNVRIEVVRAIGEIGSGDPYLVAELHKAHERDEQEKVREALDKAIEKLKKKPHGSTIIYYVFGGVAAVVAGAGYWLWKQATSE
jgi:serine/threonine-protein kinase